MGSPRKVTHERQSHIEGQKWPLKTGMMKSTISMSPPRCAQHSTNGTLTSAIQPAAEHSNIHGDQGVAEIARTTHVPGHRYSQPGVDIQEELVSMALGSCPISLSSHRDEMTA